MTAISAVVLAAGQGKRMKSTLTKVLHPCAGRPLVDYPILAALDAGAERVVAVLSPGNRDQVEPHLARAFGDRVVVAIQEVPRGTGDAARAALPMLEGDRAFVINGDAPLLQGADLAPLVATMADPAIEVALLSCEVDDATGYGRVLRDTSGAVTEIREHRDLTTDAERAVREINAGFYLARTGALRDLLGRLTPNNAQGEFYLTDIVAMAAAAGAGRVTAVVGSPDALVGVNDRQQLAEAEELIYERRRRSLRRSGVTVRGDARVDTTATVEPGVTLEAGVRLRGATSVAADATVDVGCVISDATIGPGALLKPYTVVSESEIGAKAQLGPFAHLRPGSVVEDEAHLGNFVETKKTRIGRGAKANHLAYLGDGDVGAGANIGAGTIFCNYDGYLKHRTVIGEGAFIGSDSQLVAPVTVGAGAYVASGSSIVDDVPPDALAIGRARQVIKAGRGKALRERLSAMKAAKRSAK